MADDLTEDQAQERLEQAVRDFCHANDYDGESGMATAWVLVGVIDHLNDPNASTYFSAVANDRLPQHVQLGLYEYGAARIKARLFRTFAEDDEP